MPGVKMLIYYPVSYTHLKRLLMEKNQMTEEEAYRHIQKCSMDSGTNMVETAQMLLMLMYDEI